MQIDLQKTEQAWHSANEHYALILPPAGFSTRPRPLQSLDCIVPASPDCLSRCMWRRR